MGNHRLSKGVMAGELENAGKCAPEVKRKNGRTAWQRIVGWRASRGSLAPPHRPLRFRKNLNASKPFNY